MLIKRLKSILRPFREILFLIYGFSYDFYRFIKYSGYKGYRKDCNKKDYKAAKMYHRLEKSLSFRNRNPKSGAPAAADLIDFLNWPRSAVVRGFQEQVAINVLRQFVSESRLDFSNQRMPSNYREFDSGLGGVKFRSADQLTSDALSNPEAFFQSRASVRDFSPREVDKSIVYRAIKLALHTPSVCNRQAWYVYYADKREIIDLALTLQNGNKGFGHEIPSLLIIAVDLKAFDVAGERYQQWIDGGMFSMSLVYALHSLGVSSCCLNWSKTPRDDRRIRKLLPIKRNHSIIMMLAAGYPRREIKVCYSARRPFETFFEHLQ